MAGTCRVVPGSGMVVHGRAHTWQGHGYTGQDHRAEKYRNKDISGITGLFSLFIQKNLPLVFSSWIQSQDLGAGSPGSFCHYPVMWVMAFLSDHF